MRVVKPPSVRRREIVEVAAALFSEKGYKNTAIKDITAHAGIARGLFHYYFKSKDEVLAAVVLLFSERLIASLNAETLFAECQNAVEKINCLLYLIFGYESQHVLLLNDFRMLSDVSLRDGIAYSIVDAAVQIGVQFVHEGNAAGIFHCAHPKEAAEIFAFGMEQHLKKIFLNRALPPDYYAAAFFHERKHIYRNMAMQLLGMTEPHGLFEIPMHLEDL